MRSEELPALAQRVADALPPEVIEVVLTGSVSRGMADEVSGVEMLLVTAEPLELEDAYEIAGSGGLDGLATWGTQGVTAKRVSGYVEGEPQAALPWGGFTPAGLLTVMRPGERLSLLEWMFDGALRVLRIVSATNRVWEPTAKRLEAQVEPLAFKRYRLAERITEALTEPDPRRALATMTELQLDTARLAPSGPNVDRARTWLADGLALLRR